MARRAPNAAASPTKQRILATAVELCAEKSYHGVGVAEIEAQGGGRPGALYHHCDRVPRRQVRGAIGGIAWLIVHDLDGVRAHGMDLAADTAALVVPGRIPSRKGYLIVENR